MSEETIIRKIQALAKEGVSKDLIQQKIDAENFNLLCDIARARNKGKEKFSKANFMHMTLDDLRFATPEIVAKYRAKRLRSKIIVELGAGIGGQTVFLAKESKKVIAIEIDKRKLEFAKKNCKVYGVDNVEFIEGDAEDISTINQINEINPDIIICDPGRPAESKERTIEECTPKIQTILKKYNCKNICYEAPPQLKPNKIDLDCEKEYLSVNGKLNRLDLYFGTLKQHEISVVSLPSEEKLISKNELKQVKKVGHYIYVVDGAVLHSGLMPEIKAEIVADNIITSKEKIDNQFLERFEVLSVVPNDKDIIKKALKKHDGKEVILRGNIDPKEYWKLRDEFERLLKGKQKIHLFFIGTQAVLCR